MKIIKKVTPNTIGNHLLSLGGGNHLDNMDQVNKYTFHYKIEMSETEFNNLVFLETDTTKKLIELANSRNLSAISAEAVELNEKVLGANWDLEKIVNDAMEMLKSSGGYNLNLPLLRPTKNSECDYGNWYLQDGSHRSLGYSMLINQNETSYLPQCAYIITDEKFDINCVT